MDLAFSDRFLSLNVSPNVLANRKPLLKAGPYMDDLYQRRNKYTSILYLKHAWDFGRSLKFKKLSFTCRKLQ